MHGIARSGRAEVGQPGPGQVQMCGIGVGDGQGKAVVGCKRCQIDSFGKAISGDDSGKAAARRRRLHRQRVGAGGAFHDGGLGSFAQDHGEGAIGADHLRQQHRVPHLFLL